MNKMQIICPLVALAVCAAVAWGLLIRNQNRSFLHLRAASIAHDLIARTNSENVMTLGPGLRDKLTQLLGSPTHVTSIQLGDEPPPIGDGRASVRLFLQNDQAQRLGIRLRPDAHSSKLHVIGFWTPDPNSPQ